jgi:hypothetical protein
VCFTSELARHPAESSQGDHNGTGEGMRVWKGLAELDRILRGETTRPSVLRTGQMEVNAPRLGLVVILLGGLYGLCMGWFALFTRDVPEYRQLLAAMLKVPALFLLTLLVTFPSLYVFNALVGSRLTAPSLLRLIMAALGVTLAVLASFGPIVAFFSLTTTSYPFMVLLNVLVFAIAGMLGLAFLLQTLHRLTIAASEPPRLPTPPPQAGPVEAGPGAVSPPPLVIPGPSDAGPGQAAEPVGALESQGRTFSRNVWIVFRCWVIMFALVGAQMSWVLRPFIGSPSQPFQWFRARESNFFEAVWRTLLGLFS